MRHQELTRLLLGSTREPGGCWVWGGVVSTKGYSQTKRGQQGHRHIYEALVGPIPEGRQVHHTCRNKRCVNPKHLQIVTPVAHAEAHAPEKRCRRCGGELTPFKEGKRTVRRCLPCRRELQRGYNQRAYRRRLAS